MGFLKGTIFFSHFSLGKLNLNEIFALRANGHSIGTSKTYGQGISHFIRYTNIYSITTMDFAVLQGFLAYLVHDLRLVFSTVRTYMFAVRDWAIESGFSDPAKSSPETSHLFKKIMKGAQRVCRSSKFSRLPLTKSHIRDILLVLDRCDFSVEDARMFSAALLMGYFGLLRASEYLRSSTNNSSFLRVKDVKFICSTCSTKPERMKLRLRKTKTRQFECTYVNIFSQDSVYCPVIMLQKYLANRILGTDSPLFCFARAPVFVKDFNAMLKHALKIAGYDPLKFSSHSLRSGGATIAADANVPSWTIKSMGRWKSNSYLTYIKQDVSVMRRAQSLIRI